MNVFVRVYTFGSTNFNAMKTISLKVDDSIFQETEEMVGTLKKARNRYINEALAFYNRYHRRKLLEERLAFESRLVSENSMSVLQDFEPLLSETLSEKPYEEG